MPNIDPPFDAKYFRTALGRFATGVTIITAEQAAGVPGTSRVGLTVNSFNAVSLSPPLVLWSLANTASSRPVFDQCERYVIHVLSYQQGELAMRFARGTQAERFDGVPTTRAPDGSLMLDLPCASWFECTHHSRLEAGDHTIMVGQVRHCGHLDTPPLVFHAGGFDLTPVPALAPETRS